MVAIIHSGQSFRRAVHYNENKVEEDKAQCIAAINYPKDIGYLTVQQKINRLQKQAALNEKVKVNCVHISLNFDPSEKLSAEKMQQIAQAYMDKIGFGDEPYLIYRHNDAGHPHVHIVTTSIKADGKRIPLHNLGRDKSEPARKEIEREFGLTPASGKKVREAYSIQPVKIVYGRTETKRAITLVVNSVISNYKFTSQEEFNAVLRMYNVAAERGAPRSRTYERGGLVYRVLDENGKPVGTPIKASSIYSKPTLKALEKKYAENEMARKPNRQRIKSSIDWILHGKEGSLEALVKDLAKESIQVIIRGNSAGRIYGITYIDHKTKCVFNGSDLGKEYSAQGIIKRCAKERMEEPSGIQHLTMTGEPMLLAARLRLFSFDQWQLNHMPAEAPASGLKSNIKKKKRRRPKL
jgi:hypothetical protein